MGTGGDRHSDDNVLNLATRHKPSAQIDKIERYWNSVRGKRLVPSRCEVDPRGLDGVLGHAFILERITGGLARFRIAGTHLTDVAGLELRQMPLSALFLPGSRQVLSEALEAVFEEPAVVRMAITSPSGFGRDPLVGELILMPLRSDLGDVDRVLGGLVFDGRIGRTPRRIEIAHQTRKSLTGFAGPAHKDDVKDGVSPAPRRAEPRVSLPPLDEAPRKAEPVKRGHLTLVISND